MPQQRDEVGRSGIYPPGVPAPEDAEVITPGEINEGHTGRGKKPERGDTKGVERSEDLKDAERLPRKGDDEFD